MDCCCNFPAPVVDKYGSAIRRTNCDGHTRLIRDQRVPSTLKSVASGQRSINDQCIGAMHLFHGEHPALPADITSLCRHTGFIHERAGMVPRSEKMPHAVMRQAKGGHGDHRGGHAAAPSSDSNRKSFAQSACFLKNVGTSHSSSAATASRSMDSR